MELIIDANILFSALIREGITRKIILFSDYSFFIPEFILKELNENKEEILKKSRITEKELEEVFREIVQNSDTEIIPKNEFYNQIEPAKKICPDIDDIHYFALALKLNCPIWSNDKKLKEQNTIKVLNTKEIIQILKNEIR